MFAGQICPTYNRQDLAPSQPPGNALPSTSRTNCGDLQAFPEKDNVWDWKTCLSLCCSRCTSKPSPATSVPGKLQMCGAGLGSVLL